MIQPLRASTTSVEPRLWRSLSELLPDRARLHPNRPAVTFYADDNQTTTLTYEELYRRAAGLANRLHRSVPVGSPVVMLFPPGIEFVVGFFGCAMAGVVPTPTCFPKPGRAMPRLDAVVADCRPRALLADRETLLGIDPKRLQCRLTDLDWIATDDDYRPLPPPSVEVTGEMLGLLQYTSGSTSDPKGVMVRHRNLLANLEAIRHGFNIDWQTSEDGETETGVFWLPAFHDMGLIGGILEPLYVGGHTVLMSPRSFLARPLRWLEAISRFGATTSGAPNFAYQLCVERAQRQAPRDLDLSRWQLAFCGAEPIRAETLAEFAKTFAPYGFENVSFYPCYGLAEATLLAAGGSGPNVPTILHADREELAKGSLVEVSSEQANSATPLVSSGKAALHTEIRIVDPQTLQLKADGEIGEIWLAGASIAAGYLGREEINAKFFQATLNPSAPSSSDGTSRTIPSLPRPDAGSGPYLRTGDLGALVNGELYVTGRLKDVIILRGRNLYPQDIEIKAIESIGEIAGQCAAFSVAGAFGEELAIVMEVARRVADEELPQIGRKIRSAIIEHFEADVRHLRLVRPASVPLTSSGKVQRSSCRELMRNGALKVRWSWGRSALEVDGEVFPTPAIGPEASSAELQRTTDLIQRWLIQWLIVRAGIPVDEALADRPFAEFGLDSLASVELSSELQDWLGIPLSPILAWNYPTPEKLAPHLAKLVAGIPVDDGLGLVPTAGAAEDIEDLLTQLEGLSDDEVQRVLSSDV